MTSLAGEIPNLLHLLTFNRLPQRQPDGDGGTKHPSKSRAGGEGGEGGEGGGRRRGGEEETRFEGGEWRVEEGEGEERDEKQVLGDIEDSEGDRQ